MNVYSSNCLSILNNAETICLEKYPYIPGAEENELLATAKDYAKCNTNYINDHMGLSKGMFQECIKLLQPTLDNHAKDKRLRHNANE